MLNLYRHWGASADNASFKTHNSTLKRGRLLLSQQLTFEFDGTARVNGNCALSDGWNQHVEST